MTNELYFELTPQFDTRQSFYQKAFVREYEDEKVKTLQLLSYGTLVANMVYYKNLNEFCFENFGHYSCTTTRHQKDFFKQNGLNDKEIKELLKNGILRK